MDSKFVLKALKSEMKKSKVTYKELAKSLKITEAGVKKLFGREDLSLGRIYQICDILGVSIHDILKNSEAELAKEKIFTPKQEKFLADNPNYFHFFLRLAYEQKTPQQIQKDSGISDKALFKYLKKLDDLGLIYLHANNKVLIPDGVISHVNTSGTPLQSIKFKDTQNFLNHIQKGRKGLLAGGIYYLSDAEIENLSTDLMDLSKEYTKRSLSNRSRKDKLSPNYHTHTAMFMHGSGTLFNNVIEI